MTQTRKAIQDSFLKLARRKPVDKITVKEIVDDCNINRNSFYYHFEDLPSLIESILEESIQEIWDTKGTLSSRDAMLEMARAFQGDLDLWRNIYFSKNRDILDIKLMRVSRKSVEAFIDEVCESKFPDIAQSDKELIIRSCAANVYGHLVDWMRNGVNKNYEETFGRLYDLRAGSVRQMLQKACETNPAVKR